MKIHQVVASEQPRHEIDPIRGLVMRKERVIAPGSASTISDDGTVYEVGPDGAFDVPDALGAFLCSTPGWYEGANPFPRGNALERPEGGSPATTRR